MSKLKIRDQNNPNTWYEVPAGGVGVPSGGTQGQVMYKTGPEDYATGWGTASNIGAMSKWVKLWENASPTSEFAAQTVSLSLDGYDFVMVVFQHWTSNNVNNSAFCRVGEYGRLLSYDWTLAYRDYHVETTGIYFNIGLYVTTYNDRNSVGQTGAAVIPLQIYGIKGVVNT
jgi:hypothetical protein